MTTNDQLTERVGWHDGKRVVIVNTPSGRMALVRPIAERLLKEGVITGELDGVLHATDAATVKAATMASGVCDFCSSPGIEHGFEVPDFDMPAGSGRAVGGWAACGPCGELVAAQNKKGLLDRCLKALTFTKFTRGALEELHTRFWKGMEMMVYARTLTKFLDEVADDKHAEKLPDPAKFTKLQGRAGRMEMISTIVKIPAAELEAAITDLTPDTAVKLLNWSADLIGEHAKDHELKLPPIMQSLMGTSRPPLPRLVPHWQDAFDAKSQVLTMLHGLMRKNRDVAEYFDEGIDLNDPAALKRMIQLAEYRKSLDTLSVGDDYKALRPAQIYSFNAETEAAIMQAAQSIPHDAPLSSIETPNTGAGWFWFGEPLSIAASPIVSERTHALLWSWVDSAPGFNEPSLMFSVYVKDEKNLSGGALPMLFPSSRWHWPLSQTFHEMLAANLAGWRTVYGPGGALSKRPGMGISTMGEDRVTKVIAELSLFFVMACVWFRQTIPGQAKKINPVLTTSPAQIERHARKRFQREHKLDAQVIHVVALRKTARTLVEDAPAEHVAGARVYGCRWIVAGHPRMQACGPGRKDRKLIWIESYPKGPEDKPLKTKATTIYAVVR